jgi:membrane protease YdiL (CAAX protease family)
MIRSTTPGSPSLTPSPAGRLAARIDLPEFPTREFLIPGLLLLLTTAAELVTAAVDARYGLVAHAFLLTLLVTLGARTESAARRELYWSLTLAPIIRIGSMCLPLGRLPLIAWYPMIGLPIFAAAYVTARKLGYTRANVGLTLDLTDLPRQLSLIPLGAVLGLGEYLIFRPAPLVERFTFEDIWLPAVILTIFTGLEEELIFRGVMQRAALRALGRWGLVYVSLVFAVLHVGYLSLLDVVFVFLVGQLFALFVLKTRTIFGVTLAHGAINIGLFLIFPYVAPTFLGTGYADLIPLPGPIAPQLTPTP